MCVQRSETNLLWRVGFIVILLAFSATPVAQGSMMTYGPYGEDTVTFLSVTEASGTDEGVLPLFDEPAVTGDSLIFTPSASFAADTSGPLADFTDGKLGILIKANGDQVIQGIVLEESGSVSLSADDENGSAMAGTFVSGPVFLSVLELDDVAQENPPLLITELVFSPSDGNWISSQDGFLADESWSGFLSIDIAGFLSDEGLSGNATKVLVTLDNGLGAWSQTGTAAHIDKKEFSIVVRAPEPATLALLAIAAGCALLLIARGKR